MLDIISLLSEFQICTSLVATGVNCSHMKVVLDPWVLAGMLIRLWMILNTVMAFSWFRQCTSGFQFNLCNVSAKCTWSVVVKKNLAAHLWTDSMKDMSLFVCGAQAIQTYSRWVWLTMYIEQFSLIDGGQLWRFCCRKLLTLLALLISLICCDQESFESITIYTHQGTW